MARFIVEAKGLEKGRVVSAFPNGHVFGSQEDIFEIEKKDGDRTKWAGTFVIVDIPDMLIEEAQALAAPVITYSDGPIDEITGLPTPIATIVYNSAGLFDFDKMAKTGPEKQKLTVDFRVELSRVDALPHITIRTA